MIVTPQHDYGEELGQALGGGFSSGANQLMKFKLQSMLRESMKAKEAQKPFSMLDMGNNLVRTGMDKDLVSSIDGHKLNDMAQLASNYSKTMSRDDALLKARDEILGIGKESQLSQILGGGEPADSWGDVLKKAYTGGNIGRGISASKGEGAESFKERTSLKNPTFLQELVHDGNRLVADSPSLAVGGALGFAAGGPGGIAPGSIGFNRALETGLEEYQKYIDKGKKGSFKDFLVSSGKTALSGGKGTAQGLLLNYLGPLSVLDKIPGGKKLLNMTGGKAVSSLINTASKAGIFSAGSSAIEGEMPTLRQFGKDLALFAGFDLLRVANPKARNALNKMRKKGLGGEELGNKIKETAESKGYDLNKSGDIERVVRDITEEASPKGEVLRETIKEQPIKPQSPKEVAKNLKNRPLDEYIKWDEDYKSQKDSPLTTREETKRSVAGENAQENRRRLKTLQDDLSHIQETLSNPKIKPEPRAMAEVAKAGTEQQIKLHEKAIEEQSSIEKTGKKPFREHEVLEGIDKHIEELSQAAEFPQGEMAHKYKNWFERDQKYIDKLFELKEKGEIPEKAFKDHYIKVLDMYKKGYKEAWERSNDFYKDMKPFTKGALKEHIGKEVPVMERYRNLLENNMDINEAKIKLQKDKYNSLSQLKKPLVKHHLKTMRNDLKSIQNDYVRQIKYADDLTKKVESQFKKNLEPFEKDVTNVTEKKLHNLSRKGKVPYEDVKKAYKESQSIGEDLFESLKKGKISHEFQPKIKKFFSKNPKLPKAMAGGLILGSIQEWVKSLTGIHVPISALSFAFGGNKWFQRMRYGAALMFGIGKQILNKLGTASQRRKFEKANTFEEKQKIINELIQKGWSRQRRKKVIPSS